jgi:hypothetical protein
VSTTTSPVTQTALTDVKKESIRLIGTVCELGNISNPVPATIIIKKLIEKTKAGGILKFVMLSNSLFISERHSRKIVDNIIVFPLRIDQKDLSLPSSIKFE